MDKCTHAWTHAHTHHRNVDSPLEYLGWLMVSLFSSQAGLNYRLAEYLNFAGTAFLQFEWWGSLQPNFLCSHFILFTRQQMWWCQSVRLSHESLNHHVMHTEWKRSHRGCQDLKWPQETTFQTSPATKSLTACGQPSKMHSGFFGSRLVAEISWPTFIRVMDRGWEGWSVDRGGCTGKG